jgi:hypothetical protein
VLFQSKIPNCGLFRYSQEACCQFLDPWRDQFLGWHET